MSELTAEILQQELKKLATKSDLKEAVTELATTVKQGFDAVDQRFDQTDKRFDTIEERLNIVEHKLDRALYHELDRHERWIRQLAEKVGVKLNSE